MKIEEGFLELTSRKYFIDNYQRFYEWPNTQIDGLINWIANSKEKHYISRFLTYNHQKGENNGWTELGDGQQRLTTLSLFAACVNNNLNSPYPPAKRFLKVSEYDNQSNLIEINRLKLRNKDNIVYDKIVNGYQKPLNKTITSDDKKSNIWKAYIHIEKTFIEGISETEIISLFNNREKNSLIN